MPATGELIRMMNYVDDISATLRRVSTSIPTLRALLCRDEFTGPVLHCHLPEFGA